MHCFLEFRIYSKQPDTLITGRSALTLPNRSFCSDLPFQQFAHRSSLRSLLSQIFLPVNLFYFLGLADKSRAGHTDEIRELLHKYGANKLSDVDPQNYEALIRDAEEIE